MTARSVLFTVLFCLILLAAWLYTTEYSHKTVSPGISQLIIQGQSPALLKRDYTPCQITYRNRFGDQTILELDAEIRIRGNSSTLFPKKSFSLKLPDKVILAGLPKSKNWVLVPNYLDMTFLRNKLSYDLFNSFDTNNKAALTEFVEIYFEDEYFGLYVLTQRVDANMLQLSKTGLLFKDPPINFPPGDHQKNYKDFRQYYRDTPQYRAFSEDSRAKMQRRAYFNQRYPKFEKANRTSSIHQLTELIFNASDSLFADPVNGINRYFDLQNIMDWHLLLLFSNNYDGLKKNFYLYKVHEYQGFRISPWDYDHGYGRDADGEPHPDLIIDFDRLALFKRLVKLNAANYNTKLKDRYLQLKELGILERSGILRLLKTYRKHIEPHVSFNHKKWSLGGHKYLDGASFDSEWRLMEQWIEGRFDLIETYLAAIQEN